MNRIIEAAQLANYAHSGQIRKRNGEPYYYHCARVAAIISARSSNEDMIIAAWLHDTLEDTNVSEIQIQIQFGNNVLDKVKELTNVYTKENYPHLNRKARKDMEVSRLANISNEGKMIKLADRLDNISDIQWLASNKYYIEETKNLVDVIKEGDQEIANCILDYLKDYEHILSRKKSR